MGDISAEIIGIGTEILLGEITDTNSVHIARTLRDIGLNLYYMTSVGDNRQRITDVIRIALSRSDVVITTGGLGPTVDDMTRQGVAAATDRELIFHQHLLNMIAKRFVGFHVQMTENNRRQAYLPDGALLVENPVGTAPCFIVEHQGHLVISLPGVPREMKFLLTERVVPYLRDYFGLGEYVIKTRILRTAGIGESTLDNLIGSDLLEQSNPTVGLAAHTGQTDVRVAAKASSLGEANRMIAEIESQLRGRIGHYIFGVDDERLEDALIELLQQQRATLAVCEVGHAGRVRERIMRAAAGREVLSLSQEYASPEELARVLSVSSDVTLLELAERAAEWICRQGGAAVGIAVIIQPDMDAHHADVDEGSALAVYTPQKTVSRVYGFGGQEDTTAIWTSTWAMSMTWRVLKEQLEAT